MARTNKVRRARRELQLARALHAKRLAQLAERGVRRLRVLRFLALAFALGTAWLFGRMAIEASVLARVYHLPKPPAVTVMSLLAASLGVVARAMDKRAARAQEALAIRAAVFRARAA